MEIAIPPAGPIEATQLKAPAGAAKVLILLAPANARDAAYVGAPVGPADQFENRAKLLRTMAPWVTVEPYFATGYSDLLEHQQAAAAGGR